MNPSALPITVAIDPASSAEYRLGLMDEFARQGSHNGTVIATTHDLVAGAATPALAVARCLAFCQGLPVSQNAPGADYMTDAVQTMAHGGNCVRKCILLGSMLLICRADYGMPLRLAFVWERHPEAQSDHTVVRVQLGDQAPVDLDPLAPGSLSNGGASQRQGLTL